MNSIRSAPAPPFRRSTPFLRRSTSDRILFIIGGAWLDTEPLCARTRHLLLLLLLLDVDLINFGDGFPLRRSV
jgi:hypothetical protein